MDEHALRTLVRDIVARHHATPDRNTPAKMCAPPAPFAHVSHGRLSVLRGSDQEDGACLIESAVRCNHCGYCESLGH